MANTLTPTDVYSIVNAMAVEMYGDNNALQAINTSTFVTVGEHMLRTGYTNTLNALSNVIGRTIIAARPYRGRFKLIAKIPAEWGGIERKISFYATKNEPTESFNTNLNGTQLVDGSAIDPWTISKDYPLEMNFCGIKTIQKSYTTWVDQLKLAFSSEREFSRFVSGRLINIANDIEVSEDAQNRLQVLNAIAATYDVGNTAQVVNMTSYYNAFRNTSYTTAQLLSTYFADFIEVFMMKLEGDMELAREANDMYHIFPARNDDSGNALTLLRHTPPEMRRLLLYMPLIRQAEKTVFPALFNTSYLRLENFEGVEYWQNPNVPAGIDVVPNTLNTSTGQSANGTRVQLDVVLGFFFDRDALATSIKLEDVYTTGINARGKYFNTVYHWGYNYKLDQTENMILYYMAD